MKSANFKKGKILRGLILFIFFIGGGGGLGGESSSKKVTTIKMTHVKKIGKLKGGLLRFLNGASHKKMNGPLCSLIHLLITIATSNLVPQSTG